jgi:hypothetical protein
MTQKYTLHRNKAGGFTATFPDGQQYSGNLKDIRAMFDEAEPVKPVKFPWSAISGNVTYRSTSTATWVPEGFIIPESNITFHPEAP